MKNTVFALSALAGTALSSPLVTGLDFGQINDVVATASVTGAPVLPTATTTYAQSAAVTEGSAAASTAASIAIKAKRGDYNYGNPGNTWTSSSAVASSTVASSSSTSTTTPADVPTSTSYYCTAVATGAGPAVKPDTASDFLAYGPFHSTASSAPVPTNYNLAFTDLNGATESTTYLTYKTLDSYDTNGCAAFCDATNLCSAFNVYFERDPTLDGNSGDCLSPTLASTTNIKCALFGGPVSNSSATNKGQYRNSFQVVITGSNGYNKKPAVVSPPDCNKGSKNNGWQSGSKCSGSGVMVKGGALIGQRFFAGPFDPSICAAYAEAQTAKNKAASPWWFPWYTPCNSFNAVALIKNKKTVGTYCSLFNVDVSSSTCSYNGGRNGADLFEISFSFNYALRSQLSGSKYYKV